MAIYKTGFIGCGNMATAIIEGILQNNIISARDIYVYDVDHAKAEAIGDIQICRSIGEVAEQADILFLCVKPNIVPSVLEEINAEDRAIISIAAGITLDKIFSYLHVNARVMRIMPNTPLLVGQGAVCIQTPNDFRSGEKDFIYRIFSHLGMIKEVCGEQMDAVTGISGSGTAYVYLFIDALAKAGEANGLSPETALDLAIQTFEGACGMLKQTKEPPEDLIRKVCSPGGTTIEAMKVFEQCNVCGIISQAVDACTKRSRELSE